MRIVKALMGVGLIAAGLMLVTGCWDDSDSSKNYTEQAGDLNIRMIHVSAGTFSMGSPDTDADAYEDEKPQHDVKLDAYYIGAREVTQAQWQAVMGNNPATFSGCDDCPVENVSFADIQAFIAQLNILTNKAYRLPTEAEWENACRAGKQAPYFFGETETNMDQYAWTAANSGGRTHPVGQKQANRWGLFDTYGNVEEYCQDWYQADYYEQSPAVNPLNTDSSSGLRVNRGGSFEDVAWMCRSAIRMWEDPEFRFDALGFRLARDAE